VLQEREFERVGGAQTIRVDVRVITATNRDLTAAVASGTFRQDLFYRLKVVALDIPPLRQHREDLPLLIQSFVSMFAARHKKPDLTLSSEALERLSEHVWPGNVRELRNVIEGCVVLNRSGTIQASDLPVEVRLPTRAGASNVGAPAGARSFLELPYKEAKRKFEVDYIAARLQENNGNVSRTAVQIGLHRQSLQQKLRELGIER